MPNPTYQRMGDHTESLQVDYNPDQITYQELLELFWQSHAPTTKAWSRQYMNIIFTHNREQEQLAHSTWTEVQEKASGKVFTEIKPYQEFYLAEDYHQKYYLQGSYELADEYKEIYPDFVEFINSTAVARANGYTGGYGSFDFLKKELDLLGLSPGGKKKLKDLVYSKERRKSKKSTIWSLLSR